MSRGRFLPPEPETFIAQHQETGAKLYAELADVPLYANMRIIAPGLIGRRKSFRTGWIIKTQRLANSRDNVCFPSALINWLTEQMAEVYPDHETATGMTPEEVAELEAEQAEKRKKYKK